MSSTRDTPGSLDTQDLVDSIMELKMMTANAPLSSTPAGQYTVHKSMTPISTVVGGPGGGDDGPSDDDSDHDDDDDDRDEGRRGRGRDRDDDEDSRRGTKRKRSRSRSRDNGSRRSTSRSRGSKYTTAVPKMPNLDPKNYYWHGNTAFLRYYIEKWRKLLDPSNYSPAQAVNFMLQCVPIDKQYIINDCTSLTEILNKLSLYTTDEETFLLKTINDIKGYGKPATYREDRTMLDFFDRSLSNITKLNSAFVLDYLTAQIMCNKLSHDTMRTKYIDMLTDLKIRTGDNHKVNNYLSTMQQIIVKCKVEIENMVDVNQGDLSNDKEVDNASVYSTQTHGSGDGYRGRYNSYRGYQGNHSNRSRGGYQSYKNNGKPINLDDRGNYLWDFYGNPIDASKEFDTAFALHSSTLENPKSDRGRGAPRGSRGSDRGRGLGQDRGVEQGHGSGRGANRGAQRGNDHGQGSNRGLGRGQGSNRGLGRGHDRGQRSNRGSGRGSD